MVEPKIEKVVSKLESVNQASLIYQEKEDKIGVVTAVETVGYQIDL
ncbi:hypothetical protein [Vagococcus sp.]